MIPTLKRIPDMAIYNLLPSRQSVANLFLVLASPAKAETTTIYRTTTSTTSTTTNNVEPSGYRISLGLVEISALATLIGATSAESLSLGLAFTCGLSWASMSTFGALHVVKASLAAVVPDRVRDTLGLRNSSVDSAIGINLYIDPTKAANRIVDTGGPSAVLLSYKNGAQFGGAYRKTSVDYGPDPSVSDEVPVPWAVYAFEKDTMNVLGNIPGLGAGEPVEIYQSSKDTGLESISNAMVDYAVLLASLGKVVEMYALWRVGATTIWWVTGLAWLHGLVAALVLQICGFRTEDERLHEVDVVSGELPSPFFPGGSRKILLGMPGNIRRHYSWKIVWGTGTVVNLAAILFTFVILGGQKMEAVYVWVGFQTFWLVVRTLVYRFLVERHKRRVIMVSKSWKTVTVSVRKRVMNLILGLAKQQITIHPRETFTYQEDLVDMPSIARLFQESDYKLTESLPLGAASKDTSMDATIVGVIGDTVLRSTAWVFGASLQNPDLYDCVLAFVSISGRIYAVPSVRVLSSIPDDVEVRISTFAPRGTSRQGSEISWQYWIPAVNDISGKLWLEARGFKVKEAKTEVLTNDELTRKLVGGVLNISFGTFEDVINILEESRKASKVLLEVLVDSGIGAGTKVGEGKKCQGQAVEVKECTADN